MAERSRDTDKDEDAPKVPARAPGTAPPPAPAQPKQRPVDATHPGQAVSSLDEQVGTLARVIEELRGGFMALATRVEELRHRPAPGMEDLASRVDKGVHDLDAAVASLPNSLAGFYNQLETFKGDVTHRMAEMERRLPQGRGATSLTPEAERPDFGESLDLLWTDLARGQTSRLYRQLHMWCELQQGGMRGPLTDVLDALVLWAQERQTAGASAT